MYKSIYINDIDKVNISGNLIDIRDRESFIMGHIPRGVNIPYMELIMNPEYYLSKNNVYYIYCSSGKTSKKVVTNLSKQGYNLIDLVGGFNEYRRNI